MKADIDPYVVPGDPSSGVLQKISTENPGVNGEGDDKLQAYCYRMCLSNHPENSVPFPKPEGYDPFQYELLDQFVAGIVLRGTEIKSIREGKVNLQDGYCYFSN